MSKKPQKKENHGFREFVVNLRWTYKLFWGLSKIDTAGYVIISLTSGLLPTLTGYLFGKTIDELVSVIAGGTGGFTWSIQSPLFILGSLVVFFNIFTNLNWILYDFIDSRFRIIHQRKLQARFFTKIGSLDLQQFEDKEVSDAIRRARDKYWDAQYHFRKSIDTIRTIVSVVTSAAVIIGFSIPLSLVVIILTIPAAIFFFKQSKRSWDFYDKNTELFRKMWWLWGSLETEEKVPEHAITKSTTFIEKLSDKLVGKIIKKEYSIYKRALYENVFALVFTLAFHIITLFVLLQRVLNGDLTIGSFSFIRGEIMSFSNRFSDTLQFAVDLSQRSKTVGYIKDVLEMPNFIISGTERLDITKPPVIEFKNVSFKYPTTSKYALRNVNLRIDPGNEIAIVGENGAGKTTLIKLLLRFYDPTKGNILINGIDLREVSLDDYKSLMGALFQEYNKYGMFTVKENIAIGKPLEVAKPEEIDVALKLADADDFVSKLPKKLNQVLNKRFTGGTNLSTGQWQKIALARMFYRDPKMLILDEPTASIDAVAESRIFERIYSTFEGKTVIIISHRFSTVRQAKTIYVMHGGRIVESGSHEELMKMKDGKYNEAFSLQAVGYN